MQGSMGESLETGGYSALLGETPGMQSRKQARSWASEVDPANQSMVNIKQFWL